MRSECAGLNTWHTPNDRPQPNRLLVGRGVLTAPHPCGQGRRTAGGQQPHFQILKFNLNFFCSSHDRQSTNRTPPITPRPTAINRIPFTENLPCSKYSRFASANS